MSLCKLSTISLDVSVICPIVKLTGGEFRVPPPTDSQTWPNLGKNPHFVLTYLAVYATMGMALMVATLIERRLRKAMKSHSIPALPIYPEDRPCPYPTMFDIMRAFRGVERYEVMEGERVTVFPAQLNPLQEQLLQLLEVPASLYH